MSFRTWAILLLVVVLAGGGAWAYWNYELRWRPQTITKHQAEITKILESAGWASPGLTQGKLYMVSFRTCPDCLRFKKEEFPALHEQGIDTRVIEIARRDMNGLAKSTPVERSTVAELWIRHGTPSAWELMEAWEAIVPAAWTAPGIIPADSDIARSAVIEAGRKMTDDLRPLLKDNGVAVSEPTGIRYPTLVWWNAKGEMRACACEKRETYRFVRKELAQVAKKAGAPAATPAR
ncbi:MAG: hypothetical protein Q8K11_12430 [Phenylobacterium sp.]|uniref:hypothetical protein n=1 Tax=Phenylobacterium sp. TaxID=1871053 RepID=UPI002730BAEE|nr:hypothetical protein [Phenylobacterium sp.]MDP2010973.1 hypothetical protein [Phenylobacterium sp.]